MRSGGKFDRDRETAIVVDGIFQVAAEAVVVPPIAVNEMVLAGCLIVKGFNPTAIASQTAWVDEPE